MSSSQPNPLVTIVVIAYNSSQTVIETLDSTKVQTYTDIELIITDDGSTDRTVEVCKKWIQENGNRFVRAELITVKSNTGIPANCNRGVKASQGEWIKIIAGDDILDKECLAQNIEFIRGQNPGRIKILTSNMYSFDPSNSQLSDEPIDLSDYRFNNINISSEEQYQIALRMAHINVPTVFIKRELYEGEVGLYDERYKLYEDKPWLLRALKRKVKIYHAPFFSVRYRKSHLSVQKKNSKQNLIPDFQFVRDQFLLSEVVPELPLYEKVLQLYLIYLKQILSALTRNKNTRFNNFILNKLSHFPNKLIAAVHRKYE
jgi:alpha-1,3-rhamnosyltransferase